MHLYRNALYRTYSGNLYRYCGVVCAWYRGKGFPSLSGKNVPLLRFVLVRQVGTKARTYLEFPVNVLQEPNVWLTHLQLVGRNYVSKK